MSRHHIIKLTQKKGPMTVKQLAAELNINDSSLRTCLRRARAHGTKHLRVADWVGGIALYGPGPEPDAPGGSTGDQIMAYLDTEQSATVSQMAEHLGLSATAVDGAVRRLRLKRPKRLYIAGWKRRIGQRGGRMAAVFARGNWPDAPKPDVTDAQNEAEKRRAEKRRVASAVRTGRKLRGPRTLGVNK
jgi:DNA-binding Lrp family transcriptional regulator